MTDPELRDAVFSALRKVAPEADPRSIDPKENLRDQLDIDSMDLLNFVIAVHDKLGVNIPEADYPRLTSVDAITAYLAPKIPSARSG